MKTWMVKDARARFGDVIDNALAGEPQRISRRGRDAVILVSEREWEQKCAIKRKKTPSQLLAESPLTTDEWAELLPERRPYRPPAVFDD